MSAFQEEVIEGTTNAIARIVKPLVDGCLSRPQEYLWHIMLQSYQIGYKLICFHKRRSLLMRMYMEYQRNGWIKRPA